MRQPAATAAGATERLDVPENGCYFRRQRRAYSQPQAGQRCRRPSSSRGCDPRHAPAGLTIDSPATPPSQRREGWARQPTHQIRHKEHKKSNLDEQILFNSQYSFRKLVFLLLIVASPPTESQLLGANGFNTIQTQTGASAARNSGHFAMSQLCSGKSNMPPIKRIEGGLLSSSHSDVAMNCSVLFRTKSSHQHFILRFEELKLGCDDHLEIFDSDVDYGQSSMVDLSCRDNMASAPILKTTGTYLLIRFTTDANAKIGDGFRAVITAVFDNLFSNDCPAEYTLCRSQLCISRALFCDGVNHCIDSSDEFNCNNLDGRNDLSYALALLIVLILVISICVIVFIATIYCRRESPYAQYQHHLQRTLGVPLQTSSSLMFAANHAPQYQFFQPAQMSPYVTPQHHAAAFATLPRGYSTLPLNLATPHRQQLSNSINHQPRGSQQQQQQQAILSKANNAQLVENNINGDYLLMTAYPGPPAAQVSVAPTAAILRAAPNPATTAFQQANLVMSTSQSVLPTTGARYTQPSQGQNQRQ